jgi:hypothetical protein
MYGVQYSVYELLVSIFLEQPVLHSSSRVEHRRRAWLCTIWRNKRRLISFLSLLLCTPAPHSPTMERVHFQQEHVELVVGCRSSRTDAKMRVADAPGAEGPRRARALHSRAFARSGTHAHG